MSVSDLNACEKSLLAFSHAELEGTTKVILGIKNYHYHPVIRLRSQNFWIFWNFYTWGTLLKKVNDFPISRRDVTNPTLSGRKLFNYSRPGRVWLVTSRLGTEKWLTFFLQFTTYFLNIKYLRSGLLEARRVESLVATTRLHVWLKQEKI